MTRIPFFKLHGARNDFLLTWAEDAPAGRLEETAVAICDRHSGVGADGWMLVDRTPGDGFDASIRLFNSDGSEPEISGNGTRCAAALLAREDASRKEFRIRTGAGVKHLRLLSREGEEFEFEMNMGAARIVELHANVQGRDAVLVDVGNPQCVFPVENFDFDWLSVGAATERDPRFPNRTNVSFVRRIDNNTIEVRFWERGAGHTNSSGTGSTGAAAAVLARGSISPPVSIWTPAGTLVIRAEGGVLFLTGPAEMIAEGTYACRDVVSR
ncbi:MAG TPA: diaminopimelate epimerase [Bryobacteraceae bacterium]|nr:diaminopimelate epimerase [Bryobacteraceae bacterium]